MKQTPPLTLEYAPVRNKRTRRIAGLILLALIAAAGIYAWEHRAAILAEARGRWTAWRIYRAQQACLTDLRPAAEIAFEEAPAPPTSAPTTIPTTMTALVSSRTNSPLAAFESALSLVSRRFVFHRAPTPAQVQLDALKREEAFLRTDLRSRQLAVSRDQASAVTREQLLQSLQQRSLVVTKWQSLEAQIAAIQLQPLGTVTTGIPGTATFGSTTIFLHERSDDGGVKRLLAVTADSTNFTLHSTAWPECNRRRSC